MITMLSYILFSYAAFNFPIHTLRFLHSLALASQLTLCTPFAFVLSGFSTNTAFSVSFIFSRRSRHVSRNARGQSQAGPFHETIHLKRRPTTHWYTPDTLTMPRLLRHCLRFGRYLKPFIHDTTDMQFLRCETSNVSFIQAFSCVEIIFLKFLQKSHIYPWRL